jgi:hypothetical protein
LVATRSLHQLLLPLVADLDEGEVGRSCNVSSDGVSGLH